MNEHIELGEELLERVAGGLTSSQVGQRGDAVQALYVRDGKDTPQAFLSWTRWVPHVPNT